MRVKFTLFLAAWMVVLSACGQSTAPEVPTTIPTDTPIPTLTFTPAPTTPLAILVVPADMDMESSNLYQKTVYDLAQGSGFRFQVRNTLTPADLTDPMLKVVVALPPDPGIATLAPSAPQVQFLTVNIPNIVAGGNVSALANENQVEVPAFLAGYVAALITEEYHIGMLYPQGNSDGIRAFNAFVNGMAFYCGLCQTFYTPLVNYPQYMEIPAGTPPGEYLGYANLLLGERKVYTLYIFPDLADPEFLSDLGATGAMIIGTKMPAQRPGGWVMTIQPNVIEAIKLAWPNLIAGQGGVNVQSPLGITDVDPALLSPGRERLARETLDKLIAGRISTNGQ